MLQRLVQVQAGDKRQRLREQAEHTKFTLPGTLERVWPIVRECLAVMSVAVALVLSAPPAFGALPGVFDVQPESLPHQQALAALAGAGVAVAVFAMIFVALVVLYLQRCNRLLHLAHALYIGATFGAPLGLLLVRLSKVGAHAGDALTWIFLVANLTVPGIVVIQWPSTSARFEAGRRLYAAAPPSLRLAVAHVPYRAGALLLLALLDVLLVSLPGSPVQRLDGALGRARAGEPECPASPSNTLGLSLGSAISSVLGVLYAQRCEGWPHRVSVGITAGLVLTMTRIALARRRTVLPALPLSVAFGAALLAVERFALQPLARALATQHAFL